MKILAVGDIHGDWGYLNSLINRQQPSIVLQCGDFGWWPQQAEIKKYWELKGVKPQNTKIYFCDGNHENHWALRELIPANPDGPVELYPFVYYMPRGTTMTLADGRTVLFMGGADSTDKDLRIIGHDWYPEEIISQADLDRALSHEMPVDIVISHTCPGEWSPRQSLNKKKDPCRKALSQIWEKYKPARWYHGHWHHFKEGRFQNTHWMSLDYPCGGSRWWVKVTKD